MGLFPKFMAEMEYGLGFPLYGESEQKACEVRLVLLVTDPILSTERLTREMASTKYDKI